MPPRNKYHGLVRPIEATLPATFRPVGTENILAHALRCLDVEGRCQIGVRVMEYASPFQPAIDELEKELQAKEKELGELERNANALLATINLLRSKAGQPPRTSVFGGDRKAASDDPATGLISLRHDSFFGKKMATSAREYLEMRKAAGPAQFKEIFAALKQGGYQFDTKDDRTAQASLRSLISKYATIFQKLPNGTWGLKSWYPDAKKTRSTKANPTAGADTAEEADTAEGVLEDVTEEGATGMPGGSTERAEAA